MNSPLRAISNNKPRGRDKALIDKSWSICPECYKVVECQLVENLNNIYIHKECNQHGRFEDLYWKDNKFYKDLVKLVNEDGLCKPPVCVYGLPCEKHLKKTMQIMINITDRCNSKCPICFANSGKEDIYEPSIDFITSNLPDNKKGKNPPHVVLIGGEPTLREDLPDIIRLVVKKGYIPRLSTNGKKLNNENYLLELKMAGLNWIVLQFDGLSDTIYQKLRGEKLLEEKKRIIKLLTKYDFKIQLAIMLVNDVNMSEVGKIIDYALEEKNIFWINFYPSTCVNKYNLSNNDAHAIDVINAIEATTASKIRKEDFLMTMKIWKILYKFTKKIIFKQKISTLPLIIVSDNKNYYPINRFMNPIFLLSHIRLALSLLLSIRRIIGFNKLTVPQNILFLIIEKFHSEKTVDLKEASNCHMAYMTKTGFVPFDIFNIFIRKQKVCN